MQIKTVHKMQNALDQAIKVVKFAWRHFFVLNLLHCLVIAFIEAPSVNWSVFISYLAVAIALDWIKSKIKFTNIGSFIYKTLKPDYCSSTDQNSWSSGTSYLSRDTDPTSYGSSAWNSNSLNVGSSAYFTRISRDDYYNRAFNNY